MKDERAEGRTLRTAAGLDRVPCGWFLLQNLQREGVPGDSADSGRLRASSSPGHRPHPGVSHPPRSLQVSQPLAHLFLIQHLLLLLMEMKPVFYQQQILIYSPRPPGGNGFIEIFIFTFEQFACREHVNINIEIYM